MHLFKKSNGFNNSNFLYNKVQNNNQNQLLVNANSPMKMMNSPMKQFNNNFVSIKQNKILKKYKAEIQQPNQKQSIMSNNSSKNKEGQNLSSNNFNNFNQHSNNSGKRVTKKIEIGKNYLPHIDYGLWNRFRLDQFFDLERNLQDGQLIQIVSVESHALHLQQKFLHLLEKYNKYDLIFIGVWGSKSSGKSLFLDKILNLATFQGSYFTQNTENIKNSQNVQNNKNSRAKKNKKSLSLWNIPICRGSKQRIFLVDYNFSSEDNYNNKNNEELQKITRQQQMLTDYLMFLCSEIVLVQPYQNNYNKVNNGQQNNDKNKNTIFLSHCYRRLKQSMSRMHVNKDFTTKDSFYWPSTMSFAYRNKQPPNINHNLKKLFIQCDSKYLGDVIQPMIQQKIEFSLLPTIILSKQADNNKKFINQKYLSCISAYVKHFYQDSFTKSLQEIKSNGNGLQITLMNFVVSLNCKQTINVGSILERTRSQIIAQSYNQCIKWYNHALQKQLKEQQPKASQELYQIFKKLFQKLWKKFKTYCESGIVCDLANQSLSTKITQIQIKLESYVRQKQLLILKINEKKSTKQLKSQIDKKIQIKQMPMQQLLQVRQILFKSKTIQRKLNVNRLNCIKQKMIEGWNKFVSNQNSKQQYQISKLQSELQTKRQQLNKIKERNYQMKLKMTQKLQKFNMLNKQSSDLVTKVENIKFQINIHKNINKQKLDNSYQKIHIFSKSQPQLIQQLKQYQEKLSKRNKQKQMELKVLREQLQEAYQIQGEEMMKGESPLMNNNWRQNEKNDIANNNSNAEMNILKNNNVISSTTKSNYISNSNTANFNSIYSSYSPRYSNPLISSRIAKTTQSVRLIKNQIEQKSRLATQLQEKLSNSYVNLSRIVPSYANNSPRITQSRRVVGKNKDKWKQGGSKQILTQYESGKQLQK